MRAEIWEKHDEICQLLSGPSSVPRRSMKRAMKLSQDRLKLVQKLDIRANFVDEMINFNRAASKATYLGISSPEPSIFKREALKWARMFGDSEMQVYIKEFKYKI